MDIDASHSIGADPVKEPWDDTVFLDEYNRLATVYAGWQVENPVRTHEGHYRTSVFSQNVRSYARSVFQSDQLRN